MHEPVSAIMTRDVVCVDSQDTIEHVETVMNSRNLSFVPVGDSTGNIFGIITAQQVEHFRTAKMNPKLIKAWEICTYKPPHVDPNLSIVEVAKLMVQKCIHHIVVTENDSIVGVVTSLDIVEQYLRKENP
jgi:CBS domain-containing protein